MSTDLEDMPEGSRSPAQVTLDTAVFNDSLFISLLRFWLPSYPTTLSDFSRSDILRWFAADAAVDEQCRDIAGVALSLIGPSAIELPNVGSPGAERENHVVMSAPFSRFLNIQDGERRSSSLPPAHVALALIILLDQMSRNLFRGDAQAVVYEHYDRLAHALATRIRRAGFDQESSLARVPLWRVWFYLPLEHSESLEDHRELRTILNDMTEQARDRLDEPGERFLLQLTSFEERHHTPLEIFGRFPWRNQWLGRQSTRSEEEWLREGGDRFGTG